MKKRREQYKLLVSLCFSLYSVSLSLSSAFCVFSLCLPLVLSSLSLFSFNVNSLFFSLYNEYSANSIMNAIEHEIFWSAGRF